MQEQTKLCNHYEDVRLDRSIGFLIQKHFFFQKLEKINVVFQKFRMTDWIIFI